MTDQVWMTNRRRDLAYHLISGRFTACGLPIGDPNNPARGHVMTEHEASRGLSARMCSHCYGTAERVKIDPVTRRPPR